MRVKVKYMLWLAQKRGISDEEVELPSNATIEDLLIALKDRGNIGPYIVSMMTGRSEIIILHNQVTPENGLKTRLRDGDTIILMPSVSGG